MSFQDLYLWWFDFRLEPILANYAATPNMVISDPKIIISLLPPKLNLNPELSLTKSLTTLGTPKLRPLLTGGRCSEVDMLSGEITAKFPFPFILKKLYKNAT
jgi:hypothetical protein